MQFLGHCIDGGSPSLMQIWSPLGYSSYYDFIAADPTKALVARVSFYAVCTSIHRRQIVCREDGLNRTVALGDPRIDGEVRRKESTSLFSASRQKRSCCIGLATSALFECFVKQPRDTESIPFQPRCAAAQHRKRAARSWTPNEAWGGVKREMGCDPEGGAMGSGRAWGFRRNAQNAPTCASILAIIFYLL